jgi:hypothetical protein
VTRSRRSHLPGYPSAPAPLAARPSRSTTDRQGTESTGFDLRGRDEEDWGSAGTPRPGREPRPFPTGRHLCDELPAENGVCARSPLPG